MNRKVSRKFAIQDVTKWYMDQITVSKDHGNIRTAPCDIKFKAARNAVPLLLYQKADISSPIHLANVPGCNAYTDRRPEDRIQPECCC
jgi:hypothetical protein